MNNINQYIFDITHFLAHVRDTLEYVLPREHDVKVYEQRKAVIYKGLESDTPLGRFFAANQEKTKELQDKLKDLAEDLYNDNSAVISKTGDGKIRVDHTQHLRIYEHVNDVMEQLRDILFFHLSLAKQKNESDPEIEQLLVIDDRYYRLFSTILLIQDFQKSFAEFQKVMGESQGKPTPQSNYIVQNEISKYANIIRNIRSRAHFIDNATLDVLDNTIKLIEMTEGRRERRDNKLFPDLFKEVIDSLNSSFRVVQPEWQKLFQKKLDEMLKQIRENSNKASNPQA
ncbi:MAG: hypothetical protein MJ227_01505 [Bacilli bacterium]|nr:hypothetical protein [Bacilli bacterium]